jgi:hypothetical protein
LTLTGTAGQNDWFVKSPVTVTISSQDNDGGSGVDKKYYRIGATGDFTLCTADPCTFTITAEGTTTVYAYATDKAGNKEDPPKTKEIKLDTLPPTTTYQLIGEKYGQAAATYKSPVTVIFSPSDASSGAAKTQYQINSGSWTDYSAPVVVSAKGTYTFKYKSTDWAGNIESIKTIPPFSVVIVKSTNTGGSEKNDFRSGLEKGIRLVYGDQPQEKEFAETVKQTLINTYGLPEDRISLIDDLTYQKTYAGGVYTLEQGGGGGSCSPCQEQYPQDASVCAYGGNKKACKDLGCCWSGGGGGTPPDTTRNEAYWDMVFDDGWLPNQQFIGLIQGNFSSLSYSEWQDLLEPYVGVIEYLEWPLGPDGGNFLLVTGGNDEGLEAAAYTALEQLMPAPPGPDTAPPVTTLTTGGLLGQQGWYTSKVLVALKAADDISGVKKIEYSLDNINWQVYDNSRFAISNDGTTMVYFKSTDQAGNVEEVKTYQIKIDRTPPLTTATLSGDKVCKDKYKDQVTVTLSASDLTSGLAKTEYQIDSGSWTVYIAPVVVTGKGNRTFSYKSTDNAGNVETQKQETFTINIDSDKDGLYDCEDKCPGSVIPESVPTSGALLPNSYAQLDQDSWFEVNKGSASKPLIQDSIYTMKSTFGCTCKQILDCHPGNNNGELKGGCSEGTMKVWIEQTGWASKL